MNNISKPSKCFSVFFQIVFYLHPIALLIIWLMVEPVEYSFWPNFQSLVAVRDNGGIPTIELWQRIACFASAMLPGGAIMYVYWSLSKLFRLYANGVFFEKQNVSCYRAVGWGLLVQQILFLFENALQTILLTVYKPDGEHLVAIGVDDSNFALLLVGLMVILISRIMDEGRKIQEEQRFTV